MKNHLKKKEIYRIKKFYPRIAKIAEKFGIKIRDISEEVLKSLKYDHSPPSEGRGEKIKEGEKNLEAMYGRSYKFCDLFFKSISWLLSNSLLSSLYTTTKFGIFLVLAIIGVFSFSVFIFIRIVFSASFLLRRFGWGEGRYRRFFAVIFFGGVFSLSSFFVFREVPIILEKTTYALHGPNKIK